MDEFILIFRHQDGRKVASPEQIQIWMKQTKDWMDGIAVQNKLVGGNGLLFDDSRIVRSNDRISQGPFGKTNETIGGYIIVKANSADEAAAFAKSCPVLQGEENSVEVRKIAKADGLH
jgi:hypothetical protein